jgi:UDP-N-acetylmuramate--alanine ligase
MKVFRNFTSQADVQARDITFEGLKSRFNVFYKDNFLGEILLNLPGMHNVYNSLASISVGLELDIPFDIIKKALEIMEGVSRRLEIKGQLNEVIVVDDYGHHPTEIKTTLQAINQSWPERRKIVVFQPHRYSRTKNLFNEFTRAFYQSDTLIVLPIYPAGEKLISGVTARNLADSIRAHGHRDVVYMGGIDECVRYLKKRLKSGDLLLTLGAGDVFKIGEILLERVN